MVVVPIVALVAFLLIALFLFKSMPLSGEGGHGNAAASGEGASTVRIGTDGSENGAADIESAVDNGKGMEGGVDLASGTHDGSGLLC